MACLNFTLYLDSTFPRNLWKNDIRSLTRLCEQFNLENFSIEIVHLAAEPRRGFHDGVFSTPTILLEQKNGMRQILGDLANTERFLTTLGRLALPAQVEAPQLRAELNPGKMADLRCAISSPKAEKQQEGGRFAKLFRGIRCYWGILPHSVSN
jgi:hypothetical protein